jgi:hypothetical protein
MQFYARALATALCLSAAATGIAQAAVITQTGNFSLASAELKRRDSGNSFNSTVVSVFSDPQSLSQSMSFDLFDSSLGILTGVTFWLSNPLGTDILTLSEGIAQDNGLTQAAGSVTRTLTGPSGPSISLVSAFLGTACGFSDTCMTDTLSHSPLATDVGGESLVPLAGFIGQGSFDITAGLALAAPTISYIGGIPDCDSTEATLTSSWAGTVRLEYAYNAAPPSNEVPEPGSLYLAGAALLAAIGLRRRLA